MDIEKKRRRDSSLIRIQRNWEVGKKKGYKVLKILDHLKENRSLRSERERRQSLE